MSRIDVIMLKRIGGRIILTLIAVHCLFILLETLDYWRLVYLLNVGGAPLAAISLFASASRWTLRTLSVTILIGTIVGVLDLQMRQELNIIKSAGHSIWQILRAPLVAVILGSIAVAVFIDSASTQLNRSINPAMAANAGAVTSDGAFWIDQTGDGQSYVMRATHVRDGGTQLDDVTVFLFDDPDFDRLITTGARLEAGAWQIDPGTGYRASAAPRKFESLALATDTTPEDLAVRLASTDALTFLELAAAATSKLSDPALRSAVATRFMRLLTLPLLLAGSVVIGFAFTAGYRRSNKYGAAVLYGILLGFVVYFITEVADRAGAAGSLSPEFAAAGPAFVAIVAGLTVLLYREDGRA